jgi:DNA modification methylase
MANPWPADTVERWPVAKLIPYARNARKHSDAQVAEIAGSISEWGWTIPALIDEGGRIIAGHGRVLAAHKLGITDVPVMIARGWTDAQKQAYTLADNQIALHGTWDLELLKVELGDLRGQAVDLAMLGFTLDEVRAYAGSTDDDAANEIPATPDQVISKSGDIWELGHHRLICGDATDPLVVAELMRGTQATVCFTSPPYAQQRDYGNKVEDWTGLMCGVFGDHLPLAHDGQLLVNIGIVHHDNEWVAYWDEWIVWMHKQGWRRFGWYVWDKLQGLPGNWSGRLAPAHEWIFHFNRRSRQPRKTKMKRTLGDTMGTGLRRADGTMSGVSSLAASYQPTKLPDSVFRLPPYNALGKTGEHPAVFPVALAEEVLTAFSEEGGLVYEPFAGSGTQIIAAERINRTCYAIEINPAYCDVIVERWRRVTGQEARCNGQTTKTNRAA